MAAGVSENERKVLVSIDPPRHYGQITPVFGPDVTPGERKRIE